ncbi:MAG TPA: NUDIX hydrolase [Candidatus Polarisedimenticolia bacterium]|nr:NUDIX hydrolase [Candidatus Polarisedimenticolia bacterium]
MPAASTPLIRLTIDVIITRPGRSQEIVLVRRRNPPHGWALPGGFVDYGETVEHAALREAREETGLAVTLARQFHVYSDPSRDPRGHTVAVVFLAEAAGEPVGGDDAAEARFFSADSLPEPLAFDHKAILEDFLTGRY